VIKRGASLVWAIVVSMVLFTVAVTTSNFVMKESQMSSRIDDSASAYAAAESGIEWGRYCIKNHGTSCLDNVKSGPYTFHIGESSYVVTFDRTSDDLIQSLGTTNGVNRKIEQKVTPNSSSENYLNPAAATFGVTKSYFQQFDYWKDDTAISDIRIGISDSTGNKAIYFDNSGGLIRLSAKDGNSIITSTTTVDEADLSILKTDMYALNVQIEYTRDTMAKMTLSMRDSTGFYNCVSPILVLDLRYKGFDVSELAFSKFYFYENTAILTPTYVSTDDNTGLYKLGGSNAYFDNMVTRGIDNVVNQVNVPSVIHTSGSGTFTQSPTDTNLPEGTVVTITATPATNYAFGYWTGCPSASGNVCTVTLGADTNVTANFYYSIKVYEFYASSTTDHYYSTVSTPPSGFVANTWSYFYSVPSTYPGAIPVYKHYSTTRTDHMYSTSSIPPSSGVYSGGSYVSQGVAFYALPSSAYGAVPVYQYYATSTTDSYYSTTYNPIPTNFVRLSPETAFYGAAAPQ